jgi:hypothetical protein
MSHDQYTNNVKGCSEMKDFKTLVFMLVFNDNDCFLLTLPPDGSTEGKVVTLCLSEQRRYIQFFTVSRSDQSRRLSLIMSH